MLANPVLAQLTGDVDKNGVDVVLSAVQIESTNAPLKVWFGFSLSFAEYIRATVPLTTGAAIDVPISYS
jgi:hypothetical protein